MSRQEENGAQVKLRVLQLEDDPADAELIQAGLRKDGFELDLKLAADRRDFLPALRAAPPDIILADYLIPGFGGMEALELARKALPLTPFLIISGSIGEETAVEALKNGATDYIMKDKLGKLGFAVRRALAEAANKRQRRLAEEEKERLYAEIAAKNIELEELVYISSHDLRTPLVNIQGFTHTLRESFEQLRACAEKHPEIAEFKELFADKIPVALTFISDSSMRMADLLNSLLSISRMKRTPLQLELLDMTRLVNDIVLNNAYVITAKNAKIAVGALPPCPGDRVMMIRVFSNLLDNALKYCHPDRPPEIKIEGVRAGGRLRYTVEDNGLGVEKNGLEKIWQLFYRRNPGGVPGEGIGLSMLKKIVERHGGTVGVESEPGRWTRFTVDLPEAALPGGPGSGGQSGDRGHGA